MYDQNSGNSAKPERQPEIANLNERFLKQNSELSSLIDRIERLGHRVSDTNVPQSDNMQKTEKEQLPFNHGHLLSFCQGLNQQELLISILSRQVEKLENLI